MRTQDFRQKMEAEGVSEAAIRAFEDGYERFARQESSLIPEVDIQPVESLPTLDEIRDSFATPASPTLLAQTAVLKLNGGLGTGMGLERAKSLLPVRGDDTFLDLIVKQILAWRESTSDVRFLLMNSFSTSADTAAALQRYPELGNPSDLELLQNKVPKIDAATLAPVEHPADPRLEWCPPGHGDLYAVLSGSGAIDRLIEHGIRYLFVSNSDNLGATLDPALLGWFAESGKPFVMEVTARTASDRKGGHLALRDGHFILRESAQCPDNDLDSFQDIDRHRFFNTNNLWLQLEHLRDALTSSGGFLPLPVIQNQKTVDPRDKMSTPVVQLETAMGAAIECFPDAGAIAVPRSRFAPVKTTGDLLTLRSDAYEILPDGRAQLAPSRDGIPPRIELDGSYKLVDQLDAAIPDGPPSLVDCSRLSITGPVRFAPGVTIAGEVTISNPTADRITVPAGRYEDTSI